MITRKHLATFLKRLPQLQSMSKAAQIAYTFPRPTISQKIQEIERSEMQVKLFRTLF